MELLDTSKFTKEDIGLLLLCKNNPGPSIKEMFEFAGLYNLNVQSIRSSYVKLLLENMLQPYLQIHEDYFLPEYCLVTDRGKNLLKMVELQETEKIPKKDRKEWLMKQFAEKGNKDDGSISWHHIDNGDPAEILDLADLYKKFASAQYENGILHEAITFYFAASLGYSRLSDEARLRNSLIECYKVVDEFQDINLSYQYAVKSIDNFRLNEKVSQVLGGFLQGTFGDLFDEQIPSPQNFQAIQDFFSKVISESQAYSKVYSFNIPKSLTFSKQINSISDLISEAFNVRSQSIFHSAVSLLESLVLQSKHMIEEDNTSTAKGEISFSSRIDLSMRACEVLHYLSDLVLINDEKKEKALSITKQFVDLVYLLSSQPISNIYRHTPGDNRNIQWVFNLLAWKPDRASKKLRLLVDEADVILKRGNSSKTLSPQVEEIVSQIKNAIQDNLAPVGQKMQLSKGQLAEYAVIKYFRGANYSVEKASADYDHKKVDVIAENSDQRLLIQVKSGQISTKDIKEVAENIFSFQQSTEKKLVMVIVAEQFPPQSEFLRQELENKYGFQILFIHKYQILTMHPEFARTIG